MDQRISHDDYRAIVQSLSIMRLQGWLLQRLLTHDSLDEAALIERLCDIDRQTGTINDLLNTIQGLSATGPPDRPRAES